MHQRVLARPAPTTAWIAPWLVQLSFARDGNKDITIATTVPFPRNRILIYIGLATGYSLTSDTNTYWDFTDATTGNVCIKDLAINSCTAITADVANCDVYKDATTCKTCAVGYYGDDSTTCTVCTAASNCYDCTEVTKCTECVDGAALNGDTCDPVTLDATDHAGKCLRVVMDGSTQRCIHCALGYSYGATFGTCV